MTTSPTGAHALQPLLDDAVIALRAPTQVWSDTAGDLGSASIHGVYHGDVRHVRGLVLTAEEGRARVDLGRSSRGVARRVRRPAARGRRPLPRPEGADLPRPRDRGRRAARVFHDRIAPRPGRDGAAEAPRDPRLRPVAGGQGRTHGDTALACRTWDRRRPDCRLRRPLVHPECIGCRPLGGRWRSERRLAVHRGAAGVGASVVRDRPARSVARDPRRRAPARVDGTACGRRSAPPALGRRSDGRPGRAAAGSSRPSPGRVLRRRSARGSSLSSAATRSGRPGSPSRSTTGSPPPPCAYSPASRACAMTPTPRSSPARSSTNCAANRSPCRARDIVAAAGVLRHG